MSRSFLFSSESVTEGHPDKVADFISDSVLDAFLAQDPEAKIACETLVTTDRVILAGEVKAHLRHSLDIEGVVRSAIEKIGYTHSDIGFDFKTCSITNYLHEQSADIRQGVERPDELGAGDQGMMFGYACNETPELMPAPIWLAHRLTRELTRLRKSGTLPWLRPDGKAQVTVGYEQGKARAVHTVVVSTQHSPEMTQGQIEAAIQSELIERILPVEWVQGKSPRLFINPTGRFVIGGPHGDSGLTGRKIVVDTYGGMAPHGGGAFSGKDASKVDRSAAYLARYIAKNVVAAGLADRFQVQLAYAIGVAEPVSINVEDFGSAKVELPRLEKMIREIFPTRPGQFVESLRLKRPIFSKTTNYGHFGREDIDFSWEKTDKADVLRKEFGV